MSTSIRDFWKLLVDSRLLDARQCQQLAANFSRARADGNDEDAKALAQWLVRQNIISRYQAGILFSGKPGPFLYGDYKIYARIDTGRLKGLFRAVHSATNHPVVLCFLAGAAAQDADRWVRIAALPQIEHPHLVRCLQVVDLGSYRFLVWEDLRGASLAEIVKNCGPLPPAEACCIARMAASALAQLHQAGQPHGDVQPCNLWLDKSNDVKLLVGPEIDLGPPQQSAASPEELLRRADYLAPEFAQPNKVPDVLTDIYALGCTFYELIAGRPPFPGGTVEQKLQRHATEAIQPFDVAGASPALGKTVAFIMAKNPEVRFQKATVVVEQLEPFARHAQHKVQPAPEPPTAAAFEKWLRQQQPPTAASGTRIAPAATPPQFAPEALDAPAVQTATAPHIQVKDGLGKHGKLTRRAAAVSGTVAQRVARARAQQRRNTILLVGGAGMSVLFIGAVLFALSNRGTSEGTSGGGPSPESDVPREPLVATKPHEETSANAKDDVGSAEGHGEDDGQLLWASPTSGPPIALDELPGGAQLFLIARPAEIVASAEGQRVLMALGPEFQIVRDAWEAAAGFAFREIEQLVIGLYASDAGQFPPVSCVVRLVEQVSNEDLLDRWGSPSAQYAGDAKGLSQNDSEVGDVRRVLHPKRGFGIGNKYYSSGGWSFYLPPQADGRSFVMGHESQIRDVAESGGGPPLLRREIGKLLRVSDRQRHFTLLFAPNFLFSDGRALFSGTRERALDPLKSLLGDNLKAGMVSTHFGDPFYVEMRMESDIVVDRFTLATKFRDRLSRIPEEMEAYIASLNPHAYWRRVAFRYPAMVRFLHGQTRVGVEGDHVIINAALPETAAHNLAFGAEMALASVPAAGVATAPAVPQTIEEVLAARMAISFEQDSLEFSMRNVENEVKRMFKSLPFAFRIKILGDDLRLDGITRNQQIRDFRQEDKSVAEVLTAMVRKANPVTTVRDPAEKDQKLVWVVAADPENPPNRIILVTTRQVAEQKYTLPEVFRSK